MNPGNELFTLVVNNKLLTELSASIQGEIFTDEKLKVLYATDASAYREMPTAVAIPKDKYDLIKIVRFAIDNKTSVIPRTAGTSLAGQVVGSGIVVDVSKHMNQILELNEKEKMGKG